MSVLEDACKISANNWFNSMDIPSDTHEFSVQHQKAMKKLVDKMRNNKYHRFTKNTTKFLIAVAIILSIATITVCAVETKTHTIKKYLDHSSYSVSNIDNTYKLTDLQVDYVPNGYTKNDEFISEEIIKYQYQNDKLWYTITKTTIDMQINFDTENYDYNEIENDGIKYTIYKSNNNTHGLIWNDNNYIYSIFGNIDDTELIYIAKSIK